MYLEVWPCFRATISVFCLVVPIVFPLKVSDDTLKTIKYNKSYAYGGDFHHPRFPDLSLANPTGAIALARLEFEIHSRIVKKISSENHSKETYFTRALLEYLQDYGSTATSLMQTGMVIENSVVMSVAENMIAVYRMVRRFRNYIQPWILEKKRKKSSPFQTQVVNAMNPSGKSLDLVSNDFHISIIAIITTQFVMDWKAEDICSGAIEGMELGSTLKAVHCLEIGVHAVASGMYPIGIEWIEQAVSKVTNGNDTSMDLKLAMDVVQKARAKHDERWRPKNLRHLQETFYVTRLNESWDGRDKKLWRKWRKQRDYSGTVAEPEAQDMEAFSKICQGSVEQPEKIKSRLFCWLETSVHPTWQIGPLKVELLSAFPHDMVLFHDVISKSLKRDAIEYAKPLRSPGVLYTSVVTPKTRLSFGEPFHNTPLQSRFDRLTERVTGLRIKQTNPNTVSTYPAGGHMNLHTDRLDSEDPADEMLTTMLYYLITPEIGGGTAIMDAQLNLKPPAGSALLWHYTYKSGVLRDRGRAHGSCPLIKGQKWITIQEIRYLQQTHLVCDTDEHARMEYLVNGRSKYT